MTTGKAAVFHGPGKPFELREVALPEVEPDAVLVRVSLANICGSDLHFWRGDAPLRLPADLDFTGMFHGVDERVPIDALVFGQAVLTDLLRTY